MLLLALNLALAAGAAYAGEAEGCAAESPFFASLKKLGQNAARIVELGQAKKMSEYCVENTLEGVAGLSGRTRADALASIEAMDSDFEVWGVSTLPVEAAAEKAYTLLLQKL